MSGSSADLDCWLCSIGSPRNFDRSLASMLPGRRILTLSLGKTEMTELSTPTKHAPPSINMNILSPRLCLTCSGKVGLMPPDRLALGAATGTLAASSNCREMGWAGMRNATVSPPALTISDNGQLAVRLTMSDMGPGQNLAANFLALASNSPYFWACSRLVMCTISGLWLGRPLAL